MYGSELKNQEVRKQELKEKLTELKSGRRAVACVLLNKCAGCGLCTDVCPNNAIQIERHAVVDPWLCSACCACVEECPNEAVIITQHKIAH